eukprot:m.338344 g.338344  ORF g.338344 m.338344 type:complete len:415 (-) comp18388_c0_seq1:1179-2423(-)
MLDKGLHGVDPLRNQAQAHSGGAASNTNCMARKPSVVETCQDSMELPQAPGRQRPKRAGDDDVSELSPRKMRGSKKRQALGTLMTSQDAQPFQHGSTQPIASRRPITRSRARLLEIRGQDEGGEAEPSQSTEEMELEDVPIVIPQFANIYKDTEHVGVEYIDEIYGYLRSIETKFRPKHGYMKKQKDINHGMRTILVDWLVEVAEEYKLNSHTLYIAVGYIDRFLSEMSVQRGKLQLVGVTSMLLASKYEEIYPPAVDEFVYITDNTYTQEQILKMENLVLKVLKFDMGAVTSYCFADRFLKAANADDRIKHLMLYLMELTLQDGDRYLKYLPSVVAASSLVVALHTLNQPCWTPQLEHYSQLTKEDIAECVNNIHRTFVEAGSLAQQAVREKYSDASFMGVSRILPAGQPPSL